MWRPWFAARPISCLSTSCWVISGYDVSAAGDINGDGIDDLIIGAWGADADSHSDVGSSYVLFGTLIFCDGFEESSGCHGSETGAVSTFVLTKVRPDPNGTDGTVLHRTVDGSPAPQTSFKRTEALRASIRELSSIQE